MGMNRGADGLSAAEKSAAEKYSGRSDKGADSKKVNLLVEQNLGTFSLTIPEHYKHLLPTPEDQAVHRRFRESGKVIEEISKANQKYLESVSQQIINISTYGDALRQISSDWKNGDKGFGEACKSTAKNLGLIVRKTASYTPVVSHIAKKFHIDIGSALDLMIQNATESKKELQTLLGIGESADTERESITSYLILLSELMKKETKLLEKTLDEKSKLEENCTTLDVELKASAEKFRALYNCEPLMDYEQKDAALPQPDLNILGKKGQKEFSLIINKETELNELKAKLSKLNSLSIQRFDLIQEYRVYGKQLAAARITGEQLLNQIDNYFKNKDPAIKVVSLVEKLKNEMLNIVRQTETFDRVFEEQQRKNAEQLIVLASIKLPERANYELLEYVDGQTNELLLKIAETPEAMKQSMLSLKKDLEKPADQLTENQKKMLENKEE